MGMEHLDNSWEQYSAVSSPWDCSKRSTLPGRPVHSNAILTSLGSIQPYCNCCTKTIRSDIHLSVARYSFIQLSELGQRGMNEIGKASKRRQEDGFFSIESPPF